MVLLGQTPGSYAGGAATAPTWAADAWWPAVGRLVDNDTDTDEEGASTAAKPAPRGEPRVPDPV